MENDILTVNCPYCGCKYEFDQSEYKVLSFYCAFCRVDVYIKETEEESGGCDQCCQ